MDASTSRGWCAGDSDYCTWSAASSEDDPELRPLVSDSDSAGSPENVRLGEDHCPHCYDTFEDAVILDCGHFLCSECSDSLVELLNHERRSLRRRHIRMGVTVSYYSMKAYANWTGSKSSMCSASERFPFYLSPRCPRQPKRYHRIGDVLPRYVSPETVVDNPLYTSAHCYDNVGFEEGMMRSTAQNVSAIYQFLPSHHLHIDKTAEEIINDAKITTCNVAIVGAKRTGKSSLAKRQFLNEVFFGENDDELSGSSDLCGRLCLNTENAKNDRSCEGITSRFMIEILDDDDQHANLMRADAFVVIYSVVDRKSFYEAIDLYRNISKMRGKELPTVIVGTKADMEKKLWQVASHEGQTLARHIRCPFVEVSAKLNDRVHEVAANLFCLYDCIFIETSVNQ
ncbi:unnamed protein product [Toxocara canis]|uniref:small monomeric GTPase n=1 Tax=Toxocara canis TaxID=6265 RepID=A0A183USC1_TOXCA|nr:unnamed protein product [Toxocara canis]